LSYLDSYLNGRRQAAVTVSGIAAVRKFDRADISRSVAMKLTSHKTKAAYRRYAIVAESDLRDARRVAHR